MTCWRYRHRDSGLACCLMCIALFVSCALTLGFGFVTISRQRPRLVNAQMKVMCYFIADVSSIIYSHVLLTFDYLSANMYQSMHTYTACSHVLLFNMYGVPIILVWWHSVSWFMRACASIENAMQVPVSADQPSFSAYSCDIQEYVVTKFWYVMIHLVYSTVVCGIHIPYIRTTAFTDICSSCLYLYDSSVDSCIDTNWSRPT